MGGQVDSIAFICYLSCVELCIYLLNCHNVAIVEIVYRQLDELGDFLNIFLVS